MEEIQRTDHKMIERKLTGEHSLLLSGTNNLQTVAGPALASRQLHPHEAAALHEAVQRVHAAPDAARRGHHVARHLGRHAADQENSCAADKGA